MKNRLKITIALLAVFGLAFWVFENSRPKIEEKTTGQVSASSVVTSTGKQDANEKGSTNSSEKTTIQDPLYQSKLQDVPVEKQSAFGHELSADAIAEIEACFHRNTDVATFNDLHHFIVKEEIVSKIEVERELYEYLNSKGERRKILVSHQSMDIKSKDEPEYFYFGEDAEGFPVRLELDERRSALSPEELRQELSAKKSLTDSQWVGKLKLASGGAIELTVHNNRINRWFMNSPAGTLGCDYDHALAKVNCSCLN